MNKHFHDFKDFMVEHSEGEPPFALSQAIRQQVFSALNPGFFLVLRKLVVVQFFSAAVTLFFCPQFGVGPYGGGHGLMHYFMNYGPIVCALGCGAFFLGSTALVSRLFLSREEFLVARRQSHWLFACVGALSIMALMLVGKLSGATPEWDTSFVAWWIVGGIVTARASALLYLPKASKATTGQ